MHAADCLTLARKSPVPWGSGPTRRGSGSDVSAALAPAPHANDAEAFLRDLATSHYALYPDQKHRATGRALHAPHPGRTDSCPHPRARRGFKKACIAMAAKNARIIWAVLARGVAYRPDHIVTMP